jgi:hypothetical protein
MTTILPDGSAFFTASCPLPKDHWLYATEIEATPTPFLSDATQRKEFIAAIRWAIRGATMKGTIDDFDPDALVQNATYAVFGLNSYCLSALEGEQL